MRPLLVLSGTAGALLAIRLAARPLAPVTLVAAAPGLVATSLARDTAPAAGGTLDAVVTRDPFRPSRRPASVAYDPVTLAQALAPQPPKPVLLLDGIAWTAGGAQAVLEGLPGVEGQRVVRVGDVIAGLRVRRIMMDAVVVTGMDTTWTLTVRKP